MKHFLHSGLHLKDMTVRPISSKNGHITNTKKGNCCLTRYQIQKIWAEGISMSLTRVSWKWDEDPTEVKIVFFFFEWGKANYYYYYYYYLNLLCCWSLIDLMKEKRRHDVGEPTEEIIVRFMQWVKKEKTQELFFFFCLFKKLFDTYMVMDSHLKVTRRKQNQKHKKHQKKMLQKMFMCNTQPSRLHAQLWGVRKEIHQHMSIQFRQSFYLQTLLLCTSAADNVLNQS